MNGSTMRSKNYKIPWNKWKWEHNNPKSMENEKQFLRGKFTELQAFLKTQEKSQISKPTLNWRNLEKEQQRKPKVSRRKKIIKIKTEINKIESYKIIQKKKKSMKPRAGSLKRKTRLINL